TIVEPSAVCRKRQQELLAEFSPRVRWAPDLDELRASGGIDGVIFSNELLDAMPVHRLGWDAGKKKWFEWGVTHMGDRFSWMKMPVADPIPCAPSLPEPLREVLPDGFAIEVCPAAERWWRNAAATLRRGRLLTFDYGWS